MSQSTRPPYRQGQRTLAAIVFTDAVRFSTRMSENEELTLKLIGRDLGLISAVCPQFDGHILKTTGDGVLIYFTSAIQAVGCAIEIQKKLAEQAAKLPKAEVLQHRIGIHLGDVFLSETDVMGNGVNIAARLQSEAEPGGICISQAVYEVVGKEISLKTVYLGKRELKNIREAIPIYQILVASQMRNAAAPSSVVLDQQNYRYRQILVNKVKNYWIKGVLEASLHHRAYLELGLSSRSDTVENPWGMMWQRGESAESLPLGTRIVDCFDGLGMGRSLLLLGNPGSGKTTTLLALARDLLERAEADLSRLIPVVFNLSSWTNERQAIAAWLVQELQRKYQVSPEIGQQLVREQQLILLLDGLDEVDIQRRERCVQGINEFMQTYGQTELVVCSRQKDYEGLTHRLQLQGAISLQPLTPEQIDTYLASAEEELTALRTLLAHDTTLQELARSPLMLSIMALAYQGLSDQEIASADTIEARRFHLFETYINRAVRRRAGQPKYTIAQTRHWLSWLAKQLNQQSQTIFLIEDLQPSWLRMKWQRWGYFLGIGVLFSIIISCVSLVILSILGRITTGIAVADLDIRSRLTEEVLGWILFSRQSPVSGIIFASLVLGIGCGILASLTAQKIEPVNTLQWSWQKAKENIPLGLGIGLACSAIAILSSQIFYLGFGVKLEPIFVFWSSLRGLGLGVMFILLRGLAGASIETHTQPNQGIWRSLKTALLFASLGAAFLGIIAYWLDFFMVGVIIGLLLGLLSPAGLACLHHFVLRLMLYLDGCIPWNYARFLDWATDLILLQKVGGGYIFIHRLLLEHFAQLSTSPESQSKVSSTFFN